MFRTTRIRTKLAAALAIPLLALVAVAGYEVVTATAAVGDIKDQTALARASLGPGSLVGSLQDERNRASIDLIGLGAAAELPVADNEEARALVDSAVEQLRNELDRQSSETQQFFAPAFEAYEGLVQLRADVDAYDGPMDLSNDEFADEVFGRYTDIIEAFFDATSSIALSVDDADLRNGVELVDNATRQSEMRARIVRGVVLAVVTGQTDNQALLQETASYADRGYGFNDALRTHAVGPYAGIAESTFEEADVQAFDAQVVDFLAGRDINIATMLEVVTSNDQTTGYLGLRARASEALTEQAQKLEDDALARQRLFAGIALGTLVLAALVTWLASRSITRPLMSLKSQAETMAGETLPAAVREILETPAGEDVVIPEMDPIKVKSRDEVAEVAGALSAVQTSALDLAVEQAVLRRNISDSYINLGRRNQNLLSRQLDFITDLERNESDPEALEGLFRLDHLATRMRRNAESLLVLAGIDPPRQWSAPVKVSDVVRAALGEVEDYQRVVVRHLEPASVTGSVASDVAHVLAELIENALSFSPPEQTVEVRGRLMPTGYTLAISDNGMGMSAEDLARANKRLAGEESFTVAPSRYLGHYVAGHLASRMGVKVELQDSPAGGVVAKVDLPMDVLADDETDSGIKPQEPQAPEMAAAPVEPTAPVAPAPTTSFTEGGLARRVPAAEPDAAEPSVVESSVVEPVAAAAPKADEWSASEFRVSEHDEEPLPSLAETPFSQEPEAAPEPAAAETTIDPVVETPPAPAVEAPSTGAMSSGLTRRVPGAQRPDVSISAPLVEAPRTLAEARSTPEDVYSFLSNFQSGVERGRADAQSGAGDPTEEP